MGTFVLGSQMGGASRLTMYPWVGQETHWPSLGEVGTLRPHYGLGTQHEALQIQTKGRHSHGAPALLPEVMTYKVIADVFHFLQDTLHGLQDW